MKIFSWIFRKLALRFGVPAVAMMSIAVLLLSSFVYYQVLDLSKKAISGQLSVAVDLQERELKRWIEDQKTTVVFISRAALVRERIADILTREPSHPYFKAAYRDLGEYLFSYIKNFPGLREIMILSNRGGQVLFSTTEASINEFRSRDTFFLKGRDQLFVQGVYPWRETAEPTITISRPLLDALGVKRGVLAVHLDLERMDRVVNEHPGLGRTGEIYLIDKFNTFINSERFGRSDFPRGVHTEGADRAVAGEEGLAYYANYAGIPVVGYYRWLPELEVALLAEIEQAEVFAPARKLGIIIAIFGTLLTLILGLGNFILARRIARPLVAMSDMAQRVAAGDFAIRIPLSGEDETRVLADSFNQMVQHLQLVYRELDSTAEYFRTVFNLSPYAIGIQRYDDGVFVNVNEGFCEMYGLTSEQAVGRSARELGLWVSDISRLKIASYLIKQGAVENFEADCRRTNGEIFRGEISSRLIELGGDLHVISILLDISMQRQTEQQLKESNDRLQLLIKRMPIGCITWNVDFTVSLWNPAAEKIFGYSAAEAGGKHAFDLIVPAEVQSVVGPIWQQLLDGQETAHSENANVTRDGHVIVCDWYNTPLKDEQGVTIGAISMVRDITDKKNAEENLRVQQKLLQTILNAIPAPIFFKDASGIYQGCNEAFCDYIGFVREQIIGHSVYDLAPADRAAVYEAADNTLIQQGGIQIYETKVRFASGADRDVVFHKAVYRNPDGTVGGLVGNMLDVTEIRQAEMALADSEQNYREIFNASSEAILIRDIKTGEVVDVNQSLLDMYGYSMDEALLLTIGDMSSGISPYTAEKAAEYIVKIKAGEPQLFEWQAKKKNGTLFWAEIALKESVIQGKPRMLAVIRDITERKVAERAQRESDERFHLLIEHAADALFLHDAQGVILTVNQRACESLGFSREELLGMNVSQLDNAGSNDKLLAFWASLETGTSASIDGNHQRKDGSSFPVEVNVVKFEFQGAIFFLALARDVSERKASELELERYRTRLEELVRERTKQLEATQEALVQKERMAVLGQLTATVSHELRNPLGTVKNAIYLLTRMSEDISNDKFNKTLDLADRNVLRCDGIINELLDFTRQQELSLVQIEVGSWLQGLLDEQRFPVDIKITRKWAKGLMLVCDPERMRRAVINILVNGIQALEEVDSRKRVLKVKVESIAGRLQIVITDNGPGISQEVLERIFEPMFSTKNFGVGLGMPIVKNIMEEHGGGIDIVSTPGKGTTVTLWLPER